MRSSMVIAMASLAGVVLSLPNGTTLCDYYTPLLLGANNASTQLQHMTLLVNTALIGNFTTPNVGISVTGILNPGTFNGTAVPLLGYFNGSLSSSNLGGSPGVAVNFLDDGGMQVLAEGKPCNGNTQSNQYRLLNRLYQYFGTLLGCSYIGTDGFPTYSGVSSMYAVHKYMDLNPNEFGYFISQVGLAAASFGATQQDLAPVGQKLNTLFGYRCSPETSVLPTEAPELQAICIDATCPIADDASCTSYESVFPPAIAANVTITTTPLPSNTSTARPTATKTNEASDLERLMGLMAIGFGLGCII